MLVKGPAGPAPFSLRDTSQRLFQGWRVGQIIEARVVSRDQEGTVALQIGNRQIQAHTNAALAPGEPLRLRVVSLGEQPVLERLHPPSFSNETYVQTLRHALPRQGGMGPLLANLGVMAQTPGALAKDLSASLLDGAREVFLKVVDISLLTDAETVKTALANSGLFLEAKLADSQAGGLEADLKASLLRLAAHLDRGGGESQLPAEPSPPPLRGAAPLVQPPATATLLSQPSGPDAVRELAAQVEASLARIELAQLSALSTADHIYPSWLIELPVREGGETRVFQFRIEEEPGRGEAEAQKRWSVTVAFELEGLGPMYARLTLLDKTISASLWAERSETYHLLGGHLEELRQQLSKAGLETVQLHCFHGKPAGSAVPQGHQDLVDLTV